MTYTKSRDCPEATKTAAHQDCRRGGGGTLREVQAGIEYLTDGMNCLLQDQHESKSIRREMQAAQNNSTTLEEELVTAHNQIRHLRWVNELLQQESEEDCQATTNRLAKMQHENKELRKKETASSRLQMTTARQLTAVRFRNYKNKSQA